MKMVKGKKKKK